MLKNVRFSTSFAMVMGFGPSSCAFDRCVYGECLVPCTARCDCQAGKIRQDGYCVVYGEEPEE